MLDERLDIILKKYLPKRHSKYQLQTLKEEIEEAVLDELDKGFQKLKDEL